MDWLQEEIDDIYLENRFSPWDVDDLWEKMDILVESINRETEKIKRIDKKYEHLPENKRNKD